MSHSPLGAKEPSGDRSNLGLRGRTMALAAAVLGWMFAGVEMSIMIPATRPAIQEFLGGGDAGAGQSDRALLEVSADQWLSFYLTAFLLGAALGGAVFGWLGDRAGRVKAMGLSILCYSVVTGVSYFTTTPEQLLVLRFVACMGIGGMWPTGVALVSESWPKVSRPMLAGLFGAAANVGFLLLGLLMLRYPITADSWRWVLLLGGAPALLGVVVFFLVPESPKWLAQKEAQLSTGPSAQGTRSSSASPLVEVFRSPLLTRTLLGIALGTIPLLGGWASGQRLVPWAGQVGEQESLPHLKAYTQTLWACGAVIGSFSGGWLASRLGLRLSYFLISLGSLLISLYVFLLLEPTDTQFLAAVFVLGFISVAFFGWLPYFLPELFPTRVRATGSGVALNFGRILSAVAIFSTAQLSAVFEGNIAKMGATTSLVYLIGMLLVFFIPTRLQLNEE